MQGQALRTIQNKATTGTHLFPCSEGGGQQVLALLTIEKVIGPSGCLLVPGGGFGFVLPACHILLLLQGLSLVDTVTISITGESLLVVLMKFLDGLLVSMAFMGHVIAETDVIMDGSPFNHWRDRKNIIFFVGVCQLVAAHSSPFLTLAHHEHRISWGQIAYFYKGRRWSRLAGSVFHTESVFFNYLLSYILNTYPHRHYNRQNGTFATPISLEISIHTGAVQIGTISTLAYQRVSIEDKRG